MKTHNKISMSVPSMQTIDTKPSKFTVDQRQQLAVACAAFDELKVMLMGIQIRATENEAIAFCEEFTKRLRDRLADNKDFRRTDETALLRERVRKLREALKFYAKHCPSNSLEGLEGTPTRFKAKQALTDDDARGGDKIDVR